MKKILILFMSVLVLMMSGCSNTEKKLVEQTYKAISDKDYEKAFQLSESAIDEGYTDEEFKELSSVLGDYIRAKDALQNGFLTKADVYYGMIDNYSGDAMASAIDELGDEITDLHIAKNRIKDDIKSLEIAISDKRFDTAKNEAEALLSKDLTEKQRKTVEALLKQAIEGNTEITNK